MNAGELAIAAGACLVPFALLVALLVVVARQRARRRRADLQAWARANGWTLVARPVVDWGALLPGGNKHGVSLAMSGMLWGRQTSIGEYSFSETITTSTPDGQGGSATGTTTNTHQYVVVVLHLDRPSGYLGVQPRGVLSRWGRTLFGVGSSIGHEPFDRQFRVVGDRAAAAYPLPDALVAAHVEGTVPPWTLYGTELMTCYPGRIDLDRVAGLAAPLHAVATMLTGVDAAR
jgi:hypothetical protein